MCKLWDIKMNFYCDFTYFCRDLLLVDTYVLLLKRGRVFLSHFVRTIASRTIAAQNIVSIVKIIPRARCVVARAIVVE